jgi:hypothetical protein
MPSQQVRTLSRRLAQLEADTPDYWTFDGRDRRVGAHAMFHYPAMMVPQMQGAILDILREVAPAHTRILDPFVGSGTTLVEAMTRGLDFSGLDINPLAILVSRAKATMISPIELQSSSNRIRARIKSDRSRSYFVTFPNQLKWFDRSASIALSRIARAIEREDEPDIRRVFWVVLARIIRSACNSRRSTYKLHIEAPENSDRSVDALAEFELNSRIVLSALAAHRKILSEAAVLSANSYVGTINLKVGDLLQEKCSDPSQKKAQIVITSPPYGDNQTTVPYGQYSYLPLRWIPAEDIADGNAGQPANTHATDSASLGGSLSHAIKRGADLCESYIAYKATMRKLKGNDNAQKRFASFSADLRESIRVLAGVTEQGGFHVWTVGGRRIAGNQIPMGQLLQEMLAEEEIEVVHTASRRILGKRMAHRNTLSDTMHTEQVLIACRS